MALKLVNKIKATYYSYETGSFTGIVDFKLHFIQQSK